MKNNLLLTTALVALAATNVYAASGASEITPETKWIGSGEPIITDDNQSRAGGLLNFVNHKNASEIIKDKTISGHIYQVNRTSTGTSDVFSQGSVLRIADNSQIKGFENVIFSNNHAIATSKTPGTDQDKNKATATGGVIGVWTSSIDSISGKFVNNSAEVKYTGEGEYNGSKGESAGGGAIHIEGQYGNTDKIAFVGIKNINADFENNHAKGLSYANGGAIYMKAGADRAANPGYNLVTTAIKGNFTNNSAEAITTNADAGATSGGAISIKRDKGNNVNVNVEGNFSGNSVSTNATKALGGALYNGKGNGEVNVSNSLFSNNEARSTSGSAFGGAIYNDSKLNIKDDTFENNTSGDGGAIHNSKTATLDIKNTHFNTNHAKGGSKQGGAISNFGKATIAGSTFKGNTADVFGGAIANLENEETDPKNYASLELVDTTFDGNTASQGGAIWNDPTASVKTIGGIFKNNVAQKKAGAIYNYSDGSVDIDGTIFENNSSKEYGGALYNNVRGKIKVANATFDNNTSLYGGAITNSATGEITSIANTKFVGNTTTGKGATGGAIWNQGHVGPITDSRFEGNTSSNGGAIWNGTAGVIDSIDKTNFVNNKSTSGLGQGGAITNAGVIKSISGATFEGNSAISGGAIANVAPQGSTSTEIALNDVTFKNNTASKTGGAIYNDKSLKLSGNTVFEGNKANGKLNDLHNAGTLDVSGSLTLDGGITGSNGTINLAQGTNLTVKQGVTTISGNTLTGAADTTLNMIIANGTAPEYKLIDQRALDGQFKIAKNNLYDIVVKDSANGTYEIVKKGADEIAQNTGASGSQANVIGAVTQGTSNNASFNKVSNAITEALQADTSTAAGKAQVQAALTAVSALSPEEAPLVQQTQVQTTSAIISSVARRLSSGVIASANEGAASGDSIWEKGAMWVQSLFSKAKLDDTSKAKGYDADTDGIAFGFEKNVNDDVKVGVAYAYNQTDVDGYLRDTDVDTHSAILYAEYKPAEWFVNTVVSYSWSDYEESKAVMGTGVKADYDVESFAWQSMSGYDFAWNNTILTPEAGLRYIHIDQDGYSDSMGTSVHSDTQDILTAVFGAKISGVHELENGTTLVPEARAALTYDLAADSSNAAVRLANGAAYTVDGEKLDRTALELGAGVKAEVNDHVELAVAYEGSFRDNYEDHTGLLNLKYKF